MQSIGERLEEARKRKGISIREAAEATKIRSDYLHKFESNQFDIKLPEIYVRGFLRTYANYLKVPPDKIVSDYNGLGLADTRSNRGLNREVYGRMDLSVSSAKAEKEAKETTPPIENPEKAGSSETRNPATFVPPGSGGLQLDRDLLLKGIGLLGAIVVVFVILIYFFFGRGEKKEAVVAPPPSTDVAWIHPQTGERVLTLVAADRVQATVVQANNGQTLYQGTIPRGDRRDIPYRGELRITTDAPSNLRISVDNNQWELRDPKTNTYLNSAVIQAPR